MAIVLAEQTGHAPFLLACVLLAASCTRPAVYRDVSMDSLLPSMTSQPDDRHALAGKWEYVDGAIARLTLDEQGNDHYDWKDRRPETHTAHRPYLAWHGGSEGE